MGFHQFSLALVVMIMTILFNPNCARATVLVIKSNTTYQCNGLLNGCGIGEDLESELDFFMDVNVIRILADPPSGFVTPQALEANLAVQTPCTSSHPCSSGGGHAGCQGQYCRH